MKSGIYAIRHVASGRIYIGSAVDFRKRWQGHRHDLRKGRHHSVTLQRAWRKYGAKAFVFEVLEVVADPADLIRVEQEYLDRFRSFDKRVGFNISPTAGNCLGVRASAETRARLSAARKGRAKSEEHRARIGDSNRGRKRSPETVARISAAQRAIPEAERRARLQAMSDAAAIANRGKPRSEETRARIGAAHRGRVHTEAARARMSAAAIGKKCPAVAEANRRRARDRKAAGALQLTLPFGG